MVERTCIATGTVLPAHRLIRFVAAPDGYAVADLAGRLPGRGAWVAAEADAIRKADRKGQFKRCLGVGLPSVEQDIKAIFDGLRRRVMASAALARRAGMLLGGSGKLLAEGPFVGLLAADDASPREMAKLKSKLGVVWVSRALTAAELGQICGRDSIAFAGLRESGASGGAKLVQTIHQEIMRLDGFYAAAGCNDLPDRCIT
jgi:predicted RNA-binding protein YlxR (DUF448 family)